MLVAVWSRAKLADWSPPLSELRVVAESRHRRQRCRLQRAEPQSLRMGSASRRSRLTVTGWSVGPWAARPVRLPAERARQAMPGSLGHAQCLQFASTLPRSAANRGGLAREQASLRRQSRTVLSFCPQARVRHNRVREPDRSGEKRLDLPKGDRWPPACVATSGFALVVRPASPHRP